jgi:hypothetical protein
MYFTLLFESPEGPTLTYELVFHPAVEWSRTANSHEYHHGRPVNSIQPPKSGPRYVMGDFRFLIDHEKIENQIIPNRYDADSLRARKVGIVCHDSGHGNEEDLNLLMSEMKSEGFIPNLMFRP